MSSEHGEEQEHSTDTFENNPEDLRDNDEINDAEEAFMEGYEQDADEEEEEPSEEEEI